MQLDLFEAHPAQLDPPGQARRQAVPPLGSLAAKPVVDPEPARADASDTLTLPLEANGLAPTIGNLADVLAHYSDAASDHPARRRFRSGLQTIETVLARPLDRLPAELGKLRPILSKANPAVVGVSQLRWRDVRYVLTRALRDLGVAVVSLRDETPLTPQWAALHDSMDDRKLTIGLTKFMRFCSRRGVPPAGVNSATFDEFREELEARSLHEDPGGVVRQTKRLWNHAASRVSGWPKLVVEAETDPRRYSLPWESFPMALVAEVEAFLADKSKGDEFSDDYRGRVRAPTITSRRQGLRCLISALVRSGTPASEITSLNVLCRIANARAALAFIRDRDGQGKLTPGHRNYAYLLLVVARHWLKDTKTAEELGALVTQISSEVGVGRGGIKPKNRQRLRQFDLIENHQALIALPEKIRRQVARKPSLTRLDSARLMYALMVAILLRVPMRLRNLVELELGANITQVGKGRRRRIIIHFQGGLSTKTGEPYEAELSPDVHALLDDWLRVHRRRVSPTASDYLFPNPKGELRSRSGVGALLTKFLRRELGLEMNPHLFRHLAAKTILDQDPSQMETARRVLGHTSMRTTERAYAEMQNAPAFRALDRNLAQMRAMPIKRVRGRGAAR